VDDAGQVTLELRTPFAYLKMLVDDIRRVNTRPENTVKRGRKAGKNAGTMIVSGVLPEPCSSHDQSVSTGWRDSDEGKSKPSLTLDSR
jgi:hypothetical protein